MTRHSPTTFADAFALLEPFLNYHNTQRPHQGQACQNEIPNVAFPTLPVLPSLPQDVQPNRWLHAEHRRIYRRRVNANGAIYVDTHIYYVGQAFAELSVLAQLDAEKVRLIVIGDGKVLKILPLMGLYTGELSFEDYLERIKSEARLIEQYRHWHWEQIGDLL